MGTSIAYAAEKKNDKGEWEVVLERGDFECPQSYGLYGWLGLDWRNYSAVPVCPGVHKGEAEGSPVVKEEKSYGDNNGFYWIMVEDLVKFDYSAKFENRRAMVGNSGANTCEPGEGWTTAYRDFITSDFFDDLKKMTDAGAERLIYWFD